MNSLPSVSFVLFGATGDLVGKKIAPALWQLHRKGRLPPTFEVVGFARREWTTEVFRERIRESLQKHLKGDASATEVEEFVGRFRYVQGDLGKAEDYRSLRATLSSANRLFYLAVPPELYETILLNIADSGLSEEAAGGWARLLVEKPIGYDSATSQRLDGLLNDRFLESQVYRIEHYLAKHMVQNILAFRFSNSLFENVWNKEFIERIDIRLWETLGVESRGPFYDKLGTLRDVGQNHLLQMLALTCMEHPHHFEASAIREKRAEFLRGLPPFETGVFRSERAQYAGYRSIEGVKPDSMTETYFRVSFPLKGERWEGVRVSLESGKRMPEVRKEIEVTFKKTHPLFCVEGDGPEHQNRIVFSLAPREAISIRFFAKRPKHDFEVEERAMEFFLRGEGEAGQYVEEYEKVILDCLDGERTLFVATNELRAMWRFIDPIVAAWQSDEVPLLAYEPGTMPPVSSRS